MVESAVHKLLEFFELISEDPGVVSRRIVDVILEECPYPFWVL